MPACRIGNDERRARLGPRHHLAPAARTDDVVAIADDLVALHSSDPVTVYLSVLARMRTPSLVRSVSPLVAQRSPWPVRSNAMPST